MEDCPLAAGLDHPREDSDCHKEDFPWKDLAIPNWNFPMEGCQMEEGLDFPSTPEVVLLIHLAKAYQVSKMSAAAMRRHTALAGQARCSSTAHCHLYRIEKLSHPPPNSQV